MPGRLPGRWEVADVLRWHGERYRQGRRLPSSHLKVLRDLPRCRTAELGGHIEKCDRCGHERPSYNSCRNRHCPKCQCLTKARWLEARKCELLPVPYYHVVFTLPHEINALALRNKKPVYDLLFQSVSKTLLRFGEKTLGGKIGATMILHTWDQKLNYHLHIHCAIPAGALSEEGWIPARDNYLFPVKALSVMFRVKFLSGLKKQYSQEKVLWPAKDFGWLVSQLYKKEWVVYSKRAFKGPQTVLDYIGRYTHRVAISNDRILSVDPTQVRLSYRNRSDGNKKKELTLPADEFIRRFLLHTLPPKFMKVRHGGFLSNKSKKKDLAQCRDHLRATEYVSEKKTTREWIKSLTGWDRDQCPQCDSGKMEILRDLPKKAWDTS